MIIKVIEKNSTMVAIEFIVGDTPLRSIPQITIGSVFLLPTMKKVTRNSSKERANVSIMIPIIEGLMSGNVTYLNVCIVVAPRSFAASSTEISNPDSREFMIRTAKGMQKMQCPKITVKSDLLKSMAAKNDRSEMPRMMAGSVIGMRTEKETMFLNLKLYLVSANDARVPMTTEIADTPSATYTLFLSDAINLLSFTTSLYHLPVNPSKGNLSDDVGLNEYSIITSSGKRRYIRMIIVTTSRTPNRLLLGRT